MGSILGSPYFGKVPYVYTCTSIYPPTVCVETLLQCIRCVRRLHLAQVTIVTIGGSPSKTPTFWQKLLEERACSQLLRWTLNPKPYTLNPKPVRVLSCRSCARIPVGLSVLRTGEEHVGCARTCYPLDCFIPQPRITPKQGPLFWPRYLCWLP